MPDFTEIDQVVDAALLDAGRKLKSLSGVDATLSLEPCLPALQEFARTLFDAAIDAVVVAPRLAGENELHLFFNDHLRPHMIERILENSRRVKVLDQSRQERRRLLRDDTIHDEGGDLFIAPKRPLVSLTDVSLDLDEDQRKAAPAVVQVVYEPFGLWESMAPSCWRFVPRLHAAVAQEELGRLFDVLAQRGLARRLAAGEVEMAPAAPLSPASEEQRTAAPVTQAATRVNGLGQNIDMLRLECGWTYDNLYEETGISKKRIIGHVKHGKGVAPKNLRLYTDAFSKKLGKSITVQQLKG